MVLRKRKTKWYCINKDYHHYVSRILWFSFVSVYLLYSPLISACTQIWIHVLVRCVNEHKNTINRRAHKSIERANKRICMHWRFNCFHSAPPFRWDVFLLLHFNRIHNCCQCIVICVGKSIAALAFTRIKANKSWITLDRTERWQIVNTFIGMKIAMLVSSSVSVPWWFCCDNGEIR